MASVDFHGIRILHTFFIPFTPGTPCEAPVRTHVSCTLCDVISFNGQGQFCQLTCAGGKDLSNHTKLTTIQSKKPEKNAKNDMYSWHEIPMNILFTTLLHFNPSNSSTPIEIKHSYCPAKEKRGTRKAKEKGRRESQTLLSAHASSSEAAVYQQEQEAA